MRSLRSPYVVKARLTKRSLSQTVTMSITHLTSTSHLSQILSSSPASKLSVIDFHATWCGPCHAIAPKFEALSRQYPNVNFFKCDVDQAKDVALKYNVKAMPTFILLKGTSQVDQVQGADRSGLESAVSRHAGGSSSSAFGGKGQTLGGSSPNTIQIKNPLPEVAAMDPQVKLFIGMLGAYLFFWYFFS